MVLEEKFSAGKYELDAARWVQHSCVYLVGLDLVEWRVPTKASSIEWWVKDIAVVCNCLLGCKCEQWRARHLTVIHNSHKWKALTKVSSNHVPPAQLGLMICGVELKDSVKQAQGETLSFDQFRRVHLNWLNQKDSCGMLGLETGKTLTLRGSCCFNGINKKQYFWTW